MGVTYNESNISMEKKQEANSLHTKKIKFTTSEFTLIFNEHDVYFIYDMMILSLLSLHTQAYTFEHMQIIHIFQILFRFLLLTLIVIWMRNLKKSYLTPFVF